MSITKRNPPPSAGGGKKNNLIKLKIYIDKNTKTNYVVFKNKGEVK